MILAIDETLAAVGTGRQHHLGRQLADDNRGLYAHRRLSLTTFTRKTLAEYIDSYDMLEYDTRRHKWSTLSWTTTQSLRTHSLTSSMAKDSLADVTVADDNRGVHSNGRRSRTIFTRTTISDFIHKYETRGVH
jgi:hypothetical protein